MMQLEDIDITGIDEYPADTSVKLNGPPGTGKTTESAARVATLLTEYDYELSGVMWGTYRHSLAIDTLERLNQWDVIPDAELQEPKKGATRYIATMHAIGMRSLDVGDEVDMATWQKRHFAEEEFNLRWTGSQPWEKGAGELLFDVFHYAATNKIDLHDDYARERVPYLEDLREEWRGNPARAWDAWVEYKEQNNLMDFWEQLARPVEQGINLNKPVVVVDEYHDVYPLMHDFAKELMAGAEVVIVAGDPLQVVNAYAGADPDYYRGIDLPEVPLPKTHRVPIEHWGPATTVLSKGHEPPEVTRESNGYLKVDQSPSFEYSDDYDEWATVPGPTVPNGPPWLVDEHGADTMFLTRTQKQADGVCKSLEEAGVLYKTQRSMSRDGWGTEDGLSERTALYNALQKLTGTTLEDRTGHGLSRYGNEEKPAVGEVAFRAREATALLDHAEAGYLTEKRADITNQLARWNDRGEVVFGEDLKEHVEPEFWGVYSRGPGAVRHLNKTATLEEGTELGDRDRNALKTALRKNNEPVKEVETKVYTIHASKGSEATTVVVYDGITEKVREGMMGGGPRARTLRNNEYRTWYVALTRASDNLIVLKNDGASGFEWVHDFLPSTLLQAAKKEREVVASD